MINKLKTLAETYRTSQVQYAKECYDAFVYNIIADSPREERSYLEKMWEFLKVNEDEDGKNI